MTDPLTPNYRRDVGRLVLDRYDFQKHIDGESFRHDADQITLSPLVSIDGYDYSDVQSALDELATRVLPDLPDATTSIKGIIQLAGDIGGTATSVTVTGIRGRSVNTTVPVSGDVLTFDGSVWKPSAPVNNFTAGGDLDGTNTVQTVTSITGNAGAVSLLCDIVYDGDIGSIGIYQAAPSDVVHGSSFFITAQPGGGANKNGGDIIISSGEPGASGLRGSIVLKIGDADKYLLSLVEPTLNSNVLCLCAPQVITSYEMPTGTGDRVIYISDANDEPTENPVDGAILYASAGTLNVRQADGVDFKIGNIKNPNTTIKNSGQIISTFETAETTTASPATIYSYAMSNNTAVKVDVVMVGKAVGTTGSQMFNLSVGYAKSAGLPAIAGSLTTSDTRTTVGGWVAPNITTSGSTILIYTGADPSGTVNWCAAIQVTVIEDP